MLSVTDLTVSYTKDIRAVDSVTFALAPGECAALIGANGAGKSSLLLAMMGILSPDSGQVEVDGIILAKKNLRALRARMGLVFQNPDDQLFMPDIFEDVAFGPRSFGKDEEEARRRAWEALEALNIARLARRSPLALSGGEKRLAALAAVLAMSPEYLLLDEPTAFLDPRARRGLRDVLMSLKQGRLIATHDLDFAETVCTRVLLLQNGRLAADGDIALLKDAALLEAAGL